MAGMWELRSRRVDAWLRRKSKERDCVATIWSTISAGVAAGGAEGLGLHDHAVEIVVACGDVADYGNGFVGASVERFHAHLQMLVLRAEHALFRKIEGQIQSRHQAEGHGGAYRTLAQRSHDALTGRGIDPLILSRGRIEAIKCFLTHLCSISFAKVRN